MHFAFMAIGAVLVIAFWLSLPDESPGDSRGIRYDREGMRNNERGREAMRRDYAARCCHGEDCQ